MRKKVRQNYSAISAVIAPIFAPLLIILFLGVTGIISITKIFSVLDQIKNSPWNVMMIIIAFALFYIYITKRR